MAKKVVATLKKRRWRILRQSNPSGEVCKDWRLHLQRRDGSFRFGSRDLEKNNLPSAS